MQRTVIILGMQRSGTSCMAGILEEAGLFLGKVSKYNPYNEKGNRENNRIMKLHDDLLSYNNGSWDNPPNKVEWPEHLIRQRDDIIKQYNQIPKWGFKDPRTLLTLDGWMDGLHHVSFVGTYRHPVQVANSLKRRDHSPVEKGFYLWKIYNERLLYYYNKYQFPIIRFDLPKRKYKKKFSNIIKYLDLNSESNAFQFYDNELMHETTAKIKIPEDIDDLFQKIHQIAI